MRKLATTELRGAVSETLNRVQYQGERVLLERHGKPVAAIVSADDLRILEALEDRMDLDAAKRALKEPGGKNWNDLKAELGL